MLGPYALLDNKHLIRLTPIYIKPSEQREEEVRNRRQSSRPGQADFCSHSLLDSQYLICLSPIYAGGSS